MKDISDRQKLAMIDGGYWINLPAPALRGEVVKTVIMPGRYKEHKKLAASDFFSAVYFDDGKRNYQFTTLPDYFNDHAEIDQLINIHVVAKNLVAPFMKDFPEGMKGVSAEEKCRALIRFLKL